MISMNTFNFAQHEEAKVPGKLFFILNAVFEGERYLVSNEEDFTYFIFEFYDPAYKTSSCADHIFEICINKDEGEWFIDHFLELVYETNGSAVKRTTLDLSVGNNSVYLNCKKVNQEDVQELIDHNVNLFINNHLKDNYDVTINPF